MRGPRWNRALSDPLFVLLLALQLLVVAGLVIKVDSFKHLRHLEILQLSKNHIRSIEIGAFNGLASLNTLELFDNRLTTIPNGAFEYLSKLKELWLRNNPIESIPSYAFNRVPSLRRLDLGLSNLRYLNLGMCNLKEIPNLIPLKLWMMHAQIQTIERNAFDDLQSLVELNLAHNNLTLLPHDLFTPLHHLERVHLHHNPWNCNCDILWLSWWLKEMVPANTSCCARCSTPPSHKGRYIEGMAAELKCRASSLTSVSWITPNGSIMTHGAYKVQNSSFSYFTTVTVETIEPSHDEGHTTVQQKVGPTPSSGVWDTPSAPSSTTTTTARTPLSTKATDKTYTVPVTPLGDGPLNTLDEVMKTTKIIIGCFVAITLMAAVMLIIFYKMRKQHHQQNHHAPTRTIEIINVDEDCVTGGPTMEGHLTLPPLEHEHLNHYNTYKTAYNHASTINSIHSSAHEPLLIRASSKDNNPSPELQLFLLNFCPVCEPLQTHLHGNHLSVLFEEGAWKSAWVKMAFYFMLSFNEDGNSIQL
ncbi:hypothetical protein NFI96_007090 [Prochilodus magdalenae]|nr:hypothetical protein NFI96_007090 [Prochilodus magdalenae]